MYKRNFDNSTFGRSCVASRVKYGRKGSFPIDQTSSMPFNIDPATGRPMSDIQKLVKVQDAVNQQALFASLKEYKSNYLPTDMSDEQAITFIKSRHAQTKSELLQYRENLAKYQLKQQEAAQTAKAKAEREKVFNEMYLDFVENHPIKKEKDV